MSFRNMTALPSETGCGVYPSHPTARSRRRWGPLRLREAVSAGRCQPIEALPPQVSPPARFRACARNESVPAVFLASVRTVNEPLAPWVVWVPRKTRFPSSTSLTRQCWPTLFESTSYSTSILPFSGDSLSFQSLEPLHEPRRMTSPSLANAFVVPATVNTNTPAIMTRMSRPTIGILPSPGRGFRRLRRDSAVGGLNHNGTRVPGPFHANSPDAVGAQTNGHINVESANPPNADSKFWPCPMTWRPVWWTTIPWPGTVNRQTDP